MARFPLVCFNLFFYVIFDRNKMAALYESEFRDWECICHGVEPTHFAWIRASISLFEICRPPMFYNLIWWSSSITQTRL